jgi:methyltransferase
MAHALPWRSAWLLATAAAQRLVELSVSRRHIARATRTREPVARATRTRGPVARATRTREPVARATRTREPVARATRTREPDGATRVVDDAPRAAGSSVDWAAMIAVHVALIALPAAEVAWLGASASDAQFWSCAALYAGAQALRYWSIASLGPAWNARALVDRRAGCVASGPYRWIRHPNYAAVLIEFSAIPLALGAWRAWIVLNLAHAWILARRIAAEERLLADVPGYAERMRGKPRFIPRLRGAHRARSAHP